MGWGLLLRLPWLDGSSGADPSFDACDCVAAVVYRRTCAFLGAPTARGASYWER